MRPIVVLTIVDIVVFVAALAFYLNWVGKLLSSIADGLGEVNGMVNDVIGHAETIIPDLQHTNRTLGTISGALPLLYGLADKIAAANQPPRSAGVTGRAAAR